MIIVRLTFSAIFVILAVAGITFIWTTYFQDPWTRDARVRADVIEIASNVAGDIVVLHTANNASVAKGELLFEIDPRSYASAVQRAEAQVAAANAAYENADQKSARLAELRSTDSSAVADVTVTDAELQTASAAANVKVAEAALQSARLDLERTKVAAPADGYVTNLSAQVGDFAAPGMPVIALVDTNSYRIDAFFMETKLPRIAPGDVARIRLMSGGPVLAGHVTGIARGIADLQNSSPSLLQSPQASFQWIRLAQRVPVEISIDTPPPNVPLVAGATASVIIGPPQSFWDRWYR